MDAEAQIPDGQYAVSYAHEAWRGLIYRTHGMCAYLHHVSLAYHAVRKRHIF